MVNMVRVIVTRRNRLLSIQSFSDQRLDSVENEAHPRMGHKYTFPSLVELLRTTTEGSQLFTKLTFYGDINVLLVDFCCVNDGSYSPTLSMGTASFELESADGSAWIRCECMSSGDPAIQNSYRSELVGILGLTGLLWGLWRLSRDTKHPTPPTCWDILIGCDGKSALNTSLCLEPERLSCRYRHFNLLYL